MTATITHLPPRQSVVTHSQSPAGLYGFPTPEADRYSLTATFDGYVIRDRGEVICRFHGARIDLAAATLRRLVEAETATPENAA